MGAGQCGGGSGGGCDTAGVGQNSPEDDIIDDELLLRPSKDAFDDGDCSVIFVHSASSLGVFFHGALGVGGGEAGKVPPLPADRQPTANGGFTGFLPVDGAATKATGSLPRLNNADFELGSVEPGSDGIWGEVVFVGVRSSGSDTWELVPENANVDGRGDFVVSVARTPDENSASSTFS